LDWITCSLRNEILGVVTIAAANLTVQLFMVIIYFVFVCKTTFLVIIIFILVGVLQYQFWGLVLIRITTTWKRIDVSKFIAINI